MAARNSVVAREHEDDQTLIITRTFHAPRALVFKAWTDPKHALQWWGPKEFPVAKLELDVRPGGAWRGCLKSKADGRDVWQHGIFREIVEPERLVFTFQWEEEGALETLITITFDEHEGKTEMTFRQTPFKSVASRDSHRGGWSSMFDRLESHLG